MSTRDVNADRKGPKDLLDLAHKANALKGFTESKLALEQAQSANDQDLVATAQRKHDDNFEYLMDVHNNDPEELQATAGYLQGRLAKGKGGF